MDSKGILEPVGDTRGEPELIKLVDKLISCERRLAACYWSLSDLQREKADALMEFRIYWMNRSPGALIENQTEKMEG